MNITVTSVFGESKETLAYLGEYDGRDGFACPFCASVSRFSVEKTHNPVCENGWCVAAIQPNSPYAQTARQNFINAAHDAAKAMDEARERQKIAEWSRKWNQEQAQERDAWIQTQYLEAERRGACKYCLNPDPYRRVARFVRHRNTCPKQR